MATRWQKLEAGYVRRREAEQNRATHTKELNRYYDHWDKVTARHSTWAGPQYYEKADRKIQQQREKQEKNARLADRRQRMRELLESERMAYEELMEKNRPRSRRDKATSELLFKIDQNMKNRAHIRAKLDNEAQMCGRWRERPEDENPLLQAKNDLPPPVKSNRPQTPKQSRACVQDLKDAEQCNPHLQDLKGAEPCNSRLQAELVREDIRANELKEACAIQEDNITQLNRRQREADLLKDEAYNIRLTLDELDKELELLEESCAVIMEPGEIEKAFTRNKMKVFIRKRADLYRRQIILCLSVVDRVETYAKKCAKVQELKRKYKEEMESDMFELTRIEDMCESDGKFDVKRCEDQWVAEHMARHLELKTLLNSLRVKFDQDLSNNLQRQQDVVEISNTHLKEIENSNEKMKQLVEEDEEESPRLGTPTQEVPCIKSTVERSTSSGFVNSKSTEGRRLSEQPSTSTLSAPYGTSSGPLPSRESRDSYNLSPARPNSSHLSLDGPAGKSSESLAASQSFLTRTTQSARPCSASNTFKTSMDFPMTTSTTMRNLPVNKGYNPNGTNYKPIQAGMSKNLQQDSLPHLSRLSSNSNLQEAPTATTKCGGAAEPTLQNKHLDNVVAPPRFGRKRVSWN